MLKKSIGMRLLAFVIDFTMIIIVAIVMYQLFGFGTVYKTEKSVTYNLTFIEMVVASLVYFLSFALIAKGVTVGKFITRLKVKRSNLKEVVLKQVVLRETVKSLLIVISFISFIFVIVRKDRKSLHDLIVDTIVVRRVKRNDFMEEFQVQPPVSVANENVSVEQQ